MGAQGGRLPNGVRIGYSAWMLFWVAVVLWAYGPANFFWLCNAAQFLLLWSVWREDRLILSSQAGVVVLIGVIWTADLLLALALGGRSLTGITGYMFDPDFPLLARIVSLFHVGLPVFVLWLCLRLGYDRRGWWLQCGLAAVLLIAGYLLTDPVRNINYAVAPFHMEQVWLPHWLYLLAVAAVVQPLIFLIGHLLVGGLLGLWRGKGAEARG
ncbi:MAG: hypothetical protein JJT88_04665 [Gammaproteobacteria bacterium]|nr:hypothetical protein [Gammaproteobacteria bacterium]